MFLIILHFRVPLLKKMNIYVNMFYKVLETFTKFFVFIYGLLIVAFALAFYILFHENNVEDDQVDNIFHSKTNVSSIFMSLIKTSTMFESFTSIVLSSLVLSSLVISSLEQSSFGQYSLFSFRLFPS